MGIAKNQNSVCAADDWSVGGTSGSGIYAPDGKSPGYIVQVRRIGKAWDAHSSKRARSGKWGALRYGEVNGRVMALEETQRDGRALNAFDKEMLLRGYTVLYRPKSFWDRAKFEERARKQGRI